VSEYFPAVGVIGKGALVRMMTAPALALGVDIVNIQDGIDARSLKHCSVTTWVGESISLSQAKTLENAGITIRPNSSSIGFVKEWNERSRERLHGGELNSAKYSVLVARSPHGQASAWTPTQVQDQRSSDVTITPAPNLSVDQMGVAQTLALDLVKESGTVGVMDVEIFLNEGELLAGHLSLGPTLHGSWTIEGARTSQFEQHLRAILDLPLGDPSLTQPFCVSGTYSGEGNMYRPYLHLMARSPGLKIHQYRSEAGQAKGHVTAMGEDLLDLKECVAHAIEYMSGVIDE